jgi:hypothetical protein
MAAISVFMAGIIVQFAEILQVISAIEKRWSKEARPASG